MPPADSIADADAHDQLGRLQAGRTRRRVQKRNRQVDPCCLSPHPRCCLGAVGTADMLRIFALGVASAWLAGRQSCAAQLHRRKRRRGSPLVLLIASCLRCVVELLELFRCDRIPSPIVRTAALPLCLASGAAEDLWQAAAGASLHAYCSLYLDRGGQQLSGWVPLRVLREQLIPTNPN